MDQPAPGSHGAARDALSRTYHAAAFDVDGNLLDATGELREDVLSLLLEVAHREIPLAFITGRRDASLRDRMLDRFARELRPALQDRIYVYPYNGAVGYGLARPKERFFDRPLPDDLASATMELIRKFWLAEANECDATPYKFTYLPRERSRQAELVRDMNRQLAQARVPMRAQVSGSVEESGAIVLTSTDPPSVVGKRMALEDFSRRIDIRIDDIVKVGDQGGRDGIDHELLIGAGSFCTQFCDPESKHQIDLPSISGKRNVEAWLWLIPQLDIRPKTKPASGCADTSVRATAAES